VKNFNNFQRKIINPYDSLLQRKAFAHGLMEANTYLKGIKEITNNGMVKTNGDKVEKKGKVNGQKRC